MFYSRVLSLGNHIFDSRSRGRPPWPIFWWLLSQVPCKF